MRTISASFRVRLEGIKKCLIKTLVRNEIKIFSHQEGKSYITLGLLWAWSLPRRWFWMCVSNFFTDFLSFPILLSFSTLSRFNFIMAPWSLFSSIERPKEASSSGVVSIISFLAKKSQKLGNYNLMSWLQTDVTNSDETTIELRRHFTSLIIQRKIQNSTGVWVWTVLVTQNQKMSCNEPKIITKKSTLAFT